MQFILLRLQRISQLSQKDLYIKDYNYIGYCSCKSEEENYENSFESYKTSR